jgi:hypothetical protein
MQTLACESGKTIEIDLLLNFASRRCVAVRHHRHWKTKAASECIAAREIGDPAPFARREQRRAALFPLEETNELGKLADVGIRRELEA